MVLTFEQLLAQRDQQRREAEERERQEQQERERQEQQGRDVFTYDDLFNEQQDTEPETLASNFITYDEMMARTYGENKSVDTLKQEWLEGTGLGLDVYTTDKLTKEQLQILNKVFTDKFNKVAESYSPFVMNSVVLPQLEAYTENLRVERKRKELGLYKEPDLDLGDNVEVTKTITLNL